MRIYIFLTYVIIFHCSGTSNAKRVVLNENEKKFIDSFNKNLNVKNLIITEDFPISHEIDSLSLVKRLSFTNVFSTVMRIEQLINYIREIAFELHLRNDFIEHPRKTVVLFLKYGFSDIRFLFNYDFEFTLFRFIWLTFHDLDELLTSENPPSLYIPYNCQFLSVKWIREDHFDVYVIYHETLNDPLIHQTYFGKWTNAEGLQIESTGFFPSRLDLNGSQMNFGTFSTVEPCWPRYCAYMEMIREMARIINFRVEFIKFDSLKNKSNEEFHFLCSSELDRSNGKHCNGSDCNDCIDTVEIFLIDFDLTSSYPINNWIGPLWKSSNYLYMASDNSYIKYGLLPYLKPFSIELWLCVLAWLFASGCFIAVLEYVRSIYFRSFRTNYLNAVFHSVYAFLSQGIDDVFSVPFLRILASSNRIIALFLVPSYTGAILSNLLHQDIQLPFEDIYGLFQTGTFKFSFVVGFDANYDSPGLPGWNTNSLEWLYLDERNKKYLVERENLPHSLFDAIYQMCENHNVVYGGFESFTYETGDCRILKTKKAFFSSWDVVIIRYGSPYKKIFNQILEMMRSNGMIHRFHRNLFGKMSLGDSSALFANIEVVPLEKVVRMYKLLLILYGFALVIFLAENLYYLYYKKKITPYTK